MLIAKLTIALGVLLAAGSGFVIVDTTRAIPHAGSGVDAPVLIRFVAMIVFAIGILLLGAGGIALRRPETRRWVIPLAGMAPLMAAMVFLRPALSTPAMWFLLAPLLALAIFSALR